MAPGFAFFVCLLLRVTSSSESVGFVRHPLNQTVAEGGTATFTCQIDFPVDCTDVQIYWARYGHKDKLNFCTFPSYVPSEIGKYSVYLNSTEPQGTSISTLVIKNVTLADRGEYFFSATTLDDMLASRHAFLTVIVCETVIATVGQSKDLISGSEGEFGCIIDPLQNSPTFDWLLKGADNRTVPILPAGRFATPANRLTISRLEASDNGSQVRCQVTYNTKCEEASPWYQLLVTPKTPDSTTLADFEISSNALPTVADETVADETVCETPLNLSISVSQNKHLLLGGEGEFGCNTDPRPYSTIFVWLTKEADSKTISFNTTDRFETSGNRLVISPIVSSDNGSHIRCKVIHATNCEELSPWYQILLVHTVSTIKHNLTQPPIPPSQSPTRIINTDTDTHRPVVLWLIIGSILAMISLVIILGVANWCRKYRNSPKRRHQIDLSVPTLRRLDSFPERGSHVFSSHTFHITQIGNSSGPQPDRTRAEELVRTAPDAQRLQRETTPLSGSSSAHFARSEGSNDRRQGRPKGWPTLVQVGEDMYTVPNKVAHDTNDSDNSQSDVSLVCYQVRDDLYTIPNRLFRV